MYNELSRLFVSIQMDKFISVQGVRYCERYVFVCFFSLWTGVGFLHSALSLFVPAINLPVFKQPNFIQAEHRFVCSDDKQLSIWCFRL